MGHYYPNADVIPTIGRPLPVDQYDLFHRRTQSHALS